MIKYDVNWEILIIFEKFQIVQSHFYEYSFIISQFEKINCFRVSVSLTSKVIKATLNFSWVSKYLVSKMNIDNEW